MGTTSWTAGVSGGLVAVHAHPDDETLSTGALIATFAAAGLPVTVVTCTRGERGEVLALPGTTSEGLERLEGNGPALAAHRERELSSALAALAGGREAAIDHVFLDQVEVFEGRDGSGAGWRFEDSGMVWIAPGVAGPDPAVTSGFAVVPLDAAAARLARVIREVRPSVVATYEAGGGYGHPDHVRAHQVAVRAVALAADPAWPAAAGGCDSAADDGDASDDASRAGSAETGAPWVAERWVRVAAASALRHERAELERNAAARALASAAGLTFPPADETLPAVARDDAVLAAAAGDGEVVEIDVEPVLADVVGAMRAHATQIQHAQAADGTSRAPATPGLPGTPATPGQPGAAGTSGAVLGWYALSNGVLAPIGRVETYLVADAAPDRPTSVGSAG